MATALEPENTSLGVAAIGVCAAVVALAAISVGLRFWTRIFTRLGLWWDDWLILAAVFTIVVTSTLILICKSAAGRLSSLGDMLIHIGDRVDPTGGQVSSGSDPDYAFTPADTLYMKLSYTASILYFTIAGATKLGILLMYIRIFFISDGFRNQVIVASTLVLAYWVSCTIATLFTCRPISIVWSSGTGYPDYCFNYNIFWMSAGICELLLDIVILALPIRAVMNIKLSPRRKLSVLGIFLLGGLYVYSRSLSDSAC